MLRKITSVSTEEQRTIALNIVGGFQQEEIKALWQRDQDTRCDLCKEPDTRAHRLLECKGAETIRQKHQKAVEALERGPQWHYLQLPTHRPGYEPPQLLNESNTEPEEMTPTSKEDTLVFYTDGTCTNPTDYTTRQPTQ